MAIILRKFSLAFLALLFVVSVDSCPVNPQCVCSEEPGTDIVCDLQQVQLPVFSTSPVLYRTLTFTGNLKKLVLRERLFDGLNVLNVRLSGLNISSLECHMLSGLESVLQRLDLSGNGLLAVPECALKGFLNITHLSLSRNRLTTISSKSFISQPGLVQLDFSQNAIQTFSSDSLGLPRLNYLNLSDNSIKGHISKESFLGLGHLKILDLSRNGVNSFSDDAFAALSSLQTLILDDNKIFHMIGAISPLNRLEHLSLSDNYVEKLYDETFKNTTELTSLDLSGNQLTGIPSFIWSLPKLKEVSLARNKLMETSATKPNIHVNQILRRLDLSNNNLAVVSQLFVRADETLELLLMNNRIVTVHNMTIYTCGRGDCQIKINLSVNQLTASPDIRFVFNDSNRRGTNVHIDLSNNTIREFDKFHPRVHSLKPLSLENFRFSYTLRHNGLKDFPPCFFFRMYKMEILDLSFNSLTEFPKGSCVAGAVKNLLLGNNGIKQIDQIYFGKSNSPIMESIALNDNEIRVISADAFRGLAESVHEIDLRNNQLNVLPGHLFLELLHKLKVAGNPLKCSCGEYLKVNTSSWSGVLDDARCSEPRLKKGFQLKCVLRECSKIESGESCALDNFVGLQANVSSTEKGFNLTWALFGPGKSTGIRVNISEVNHSVHMYTHLIHPEITTDSFINAKPDRTYDICIEVLVPNVYSTSKQCFLNISYVAENGDTSTGSGVKYVTWIAILGSSLILFMFLSVALLAVYVRSKRQSINETRSVHGHVLGRGQSIPNKDRSKASVLDRLRRATQRYEEPSGDIIQMQPVNLEEYPEQRYDDPSENTNTDNLSRQLIYEDSAYEPARPDPITPSSSKVPLLQDIEVEDLHSLHVDDNPEPIAQEDMSVRTSKTSFGNTPSVSGNSDRLSEAQMCDTPINYSSEVVQPGNGVSPPLQPDIADGDVDKGEAPIRVFASVRSLQQTPASSVERESVKPRARVPPVVKIDTNTHSEASAVHIAPISQHPDTTTEVKVDKVKPSKRRVNGGESIFVNPRLASDTSSSYSSGFSSPDTDDGQVFLSVGFDNPNYDSYRRPFEEDDEETIPKTLTGVDEETILKIPAGYDDIIRKTPAGYEETIPKTPAGYEETVWKTPAEFEEIVPKTLESVDEKTILEIPAGYREVISKTAASSDEAIPKTPAEIEETFPKTLTGVDEDTTPKTHAADHEKTTRKRPEGYEETYPMTLICDEETTPKTPADDDVENAQIKNADNDSDWVMVPI